MKNILKIFIVFFFSSNLYSQNQLVTYPTTPYGSLDTIKNPSIYPALEHCGNIANYKIGYNTDFSVRVKKATDTNWIDLFEYNTFVNSSTGDLSRVTRSSFVSFDYSGTVNIEITCNNFSSIAGKVMIRPLSRNISQSISGNVLTLTLTSPSSNCVSNGKSYSDKLSIEINGDRYRNLQIFANKIQNISPPSGSNVIIYEKANNGQTANIYNKAILDGVSKKIIIRDGAIVVVPFLVTDEDQQSNINLISNDEIYIEGGGVLKGGIKATNADNIKIYGHGIIDLTNFPKQYELTPNRYHYNQGVTLRYCTNVILDGLTINDSQQMCVEIMDCGGLFNSPPENISINDIKMFSRVVWGDGFHMKGTSNVSINDCFARTSDDCVTVYASRLDDTSNRDALNIKVTNSLLYADRAHDIVIGWHGNRTATGNNIYNLFFDNIDILEHDQLWVDPSGFIHTEYDGAIGIACSDGNKCENFLFRNIRVEDFTNGSILTVRVMPSKTGDAVTDGKYVKDIRFENFSYNGSGEHKSVIQGLNCDEYVNGVHFQNFKINGQLITKLSDYVLPLSQVTSVPPIYNTSGFDTNPYAYNITFEEGNNYSNSLSDGYYTIENYGASGNFLQNQNTSSYIMSNNSNTNNSRVWKISAVRSNGLPTGQYRIQPYIDNTKTLSNSIDVIPYFLCQGRYLSNDMTNLLFTNQEWKIVGNNSIGYNINNAFTRSYLTYINFSPINNTFAFLKDVTNNYQKWKIVPCVPSQNKSSNIEINPDSNISDDGQIIIFPNPTNNLLNINNVKDYSDAKIEILDIKGSKLIVKQINSESSEINVANLAQGIYLVKIERSGNIIFTGKFIKN